MKTKFLQSQSGSKSSSRLIGFIVVCAALLFAQEVLFFGRENIVSASISAGTLFLTMATPAMVFLFKQKETEIKAATNNQDKYTTAP